MLRAIIVILLLVQALAAQAGVAGFACPHASAGATPHMQMTHAQQAAADQSGTQPDLCCCHAVGHCSSTAVTSQAISLTHAYASERMVSHAVVAAAPGYGNTPYRPPSISA